MPQIGWFEILIVVVLAVLVIGPKDFPIVLKKIGNWVSAVKRYFNEIQKGVTDIENTVEEEVSLDENYLNKNKDTKKR